MRIFYILLLIAYPLIQQLYATPTFPFKKAEEVNYNAYWSFFKIAEIKTYIDTPIIFLNEKPCYKTEITAKMSAVVRVFATIDEIFGAYIDTTTFLPTSSYRYLKEGKYIHDEVSYYDYEKKKLLLTVRNKNTGAFENKDSFTIHKNIFDLVTGYLQFRNIDLENKKIGDVILTNIFIEHELFPIALTLSAFEQIKVKGGKFNTICFIPTIPTNQVFNNKYPMKMWISNDQNKIIIKAEVKLSFGKSTLELANYKNLAHPLTFKNSLTYPLVLFVNHII